MWKKNTEVISQLFQCFILHVTTSEIISKSFRPLKLFQKYFSDTEDVGKYSWPAINLRNNFETILGKILSVRTSTKAALILKWLYFTYNHGIKPWPPCDQANSVEVVKSAMRDKPLIGGNLSIALLKRQLNGILRIMKGVQHKSLLVFYQTYLQHNTSHIQAPDLQKT